MIEFELTKNQRGIRLSGDETNLQLFYDEIHSLIPCEMDKDYDIDEDGKQIEQVLNLAYDVRKVYTGCRFVTQSPDGSKIYSFNFILPLFLFQLHILKQLSISRNLPCLVVDKAIADITLQIAKKISNVDTAIAIRDWVINSEKFGSDYLFSASEVDIYNFLNWNLSQSRLDFLPTLLKNASPKSKVYLKTYKEYGKISKEKGVSIYNIGHQPYEDFLNNLYQNLQNFEKYEW